MRFFIIFILFIFTISLHAETLKIVTGDYAPYSGESLPDGGVSTQVVRAAFNEVGLNIAVEFIPWNRAMNYLKSGSVSGSFPWTKNSEREKDVFYSDPIHKYRLLTFVNKNSGLDKKFNPIGKKVCLPSGWDDSFIKEMVLAKSLMVERPINMKSCFQMLAMERVDLIVANENVGMGIIKALYKDNAPFAGVETEFVHGQTNLYFLVPKKIPNAQKILSEFNRGLQIIKKNGKYDSLIHELNHRDISKSNCDFCNRLGLL